MRVSFALVGFTALLAGCIKQSADPGEFLRKFTTAENRNLVSAMGGVFQFEVSLLNSNFFAARLASDAESLDGRKLRFIREDAISKYSQGLYFIVRITRVGEPRSVDGFDPEMATLQKLLQSRQEYLREQIRLRASGREHLFPSQVVASSLPGQKPTCTLLIAFPTPENSYRDWDYLSLAGIESLPLALDFPVDQLRPNLRLTL